MSVRSGVAIFFLALGSVPGTLRAQEPLTDVRLLATDTLPDVALTRRENGRAVIYYNPALIERVGPLLRDFFIAHEFGHIFYDHDGGALAGRDSNLVEVRQRQELEADCYAAARLARSSRASIEAAVQFFSRMGLFSHDRFHPSGSRRAANLLACLPAVQADPEREARRTGAGCERGGGDDHRAWTRCGRPTAWARADPDRRSARGHHLDPRADDADHRQAPAAGPAPL